jgi:hypothetical protein
MHLLFRCMFCDMFVIRGTHCISSHVFISKSVVITNNYCLYISLSEECAYRIGMINYFSVEVTVKSYPCNRPWTPIGLWEVEAPTFSRQLAHRRRWGCQPYAPATLYPPGRFLVLISVRDWVGRIKSIETSTRPSSLKHSASTNYSTACPLEVTVPKDY